MFSCEAVGTVRKHPLPINQSTSTTYQQNPHISTEYCSDPGFITLQPFQHGDGGDSSSLACCYKNSKVASLVKST